MLYVYDLQAKKIFNTLMLNHFSTTEFKLWFDYWLCPLFKSADTLDIKHFEEIVISAVELTPDITNLIHE